MTDVHTITPDDIHEIKPELEKLDRIIQILEDMQAYQIEIYTLLYQRMKE